MMGSSTALCSVLRWTPNNDVLWSAQDSRPGGSVVRNTSRLWMWMNTVSIQASKSGLTSYSSSSRVVFSATRRRGRCVASSLGLLLPAFPRLLLLIPLRAFACCLSSLLPFLFALVLRSLGRLGVHPLPRNMFPLHFWRLMLSSW